MHLWLVHWIKKFTRDTACRLLYSLKAKGESQHGHNHIVKTERQMEVEAHHLSFLQPAPSLPRVTPTTEYCSLQNLPIKTGGRCACSEVVEKGWSRSGRGWTGGTHQTIDRGTVLNRKPVSIPHGVPGCLPFSYVPRSTASMQERWNENRWQLVI